MIQYFRSYPTLGRRYGDLPRNVKLFIWIILGIAIVLTVLTLILVGQPPLQWEHVFFFLVFSFLMELYSDSISHKEAPSQLFDIGIFFAGFSVVVFQNVWVLLMTIALAQISSYLFGTRRVHAMAFNVAQRMNGGLPLLWILVILGPVNTSDPILVLLISFVLAMVFNIIITFETRAVLALVEKRSMLRMLTHDYELGDEVFAVSILLIAFSVALAIPDFYYVFFLMLLIIILERADAMREARKVDLTIRDHLDKIGNPLFSLDGYLQLMRIQLEQEQLNRDALKETLDGAIREIDSIKNEIKKSGDK